MTSSTIQIETTSLDAAYEAAHNGAVLVDRSELGMLKFSGESRLDLLNRMSTQKVIDLSSGQGAATVLTTDIGRTIDRLILYASSANVYCLTGENNGEAIAAYLKRFVFFMDDFKVVDLTAATAILAVYGRQARELLFELFGDSVDIPLHHWRQVAIEGVTAYIHRTDPVAGEGYFISCQAEERPALWARLLSTDLAPIDEQAFEYLRIESALPRFGRELSQEYIPLETDLWADVSFNKGCYTGQEIIARMESRGRLAKKMVRLRSDTVLEIGQELVAAGRKAGRITSAADGPAGPLALGYVKTTVLETEPELQAGPAAVTIVAGSKPV